MQNLYRVKVEGYLVIAANSLSDAQDRAGSHASEADLDFDAVKIESESDLPDGWDMSDDPANIHCEIEEFLK